ncbi:class I SAM-dependent RNA methyltransferase [Crenalkalicoccus roseus]|uniref:class I SAM-dependent RNA methyltransferase n=1 Tax=Crenalkalicoccus roseus TaxID=1485588 RepID=UPI0018653394|nr:class I SAM-dependent RNA methyltransferase [Crenalkalicoccus roseus]
MSDTLTELTIEAMGAAGDGIARLPGGADCFVVGALPGERVRARPLPGRAVPAEAVTRPSPERVAPPCTHFGACGGCALQHWAEAPCADWKRARLAEALARAGAPDAPVAPLRLSPPGTRRRADLALRRGPGGVAVGFHARGDVAVVDLAECHVLDPRLVALLPPLRAALRGLAALRREGSAVLNLLETGPDLLLRTDGVLDAAGRAALAAFAAAHGLPRVAWARGSGAPEVAAQHGPALIRFAGVPVSPPPGAFLQATPEGEAAIVEAVLAALPERLPARARIAELYAGVGTLSFPLAARARIAAFEGAAEAVAALSAAARQAGARVEAARRDLARQPLLPKELAPFAAVVLDPPFAGAAEQVGLIARARVPLVVYVSCNPAALARDARALLGAGYRVRQAVPVDQFRWSTHLESVIAFGL